MDDDALIDAALDGDSSAFGDLVARYQDRLFHTVAHVVGSVEDARDIVQDAFVQAYVKLETFQRNAAFYTWVYRIALNGAISSRRRKRPAVSLDAAREGIGLEPACGQAAPGDRLEQQEVAGQVRAALAALTDEHRTILVMREMDGHDYETIAELLELPVGTVRSRLHRARLELRDQLKQVLQEDRR